MLWLHPDGKQKLSIFPRNRHWLGKLVWLSSVDRKLLVNTRKYSQALTNAGHDFHECAKFAHSWNS